MLLLFLVFVVLIFPKPVQAYLDPGTGSYVFQILIAGAIGGSIAFKSSWKKIIELLKRKTKSGTDEKDK